MATIKKVLFMFVIVAALFFVALFAGILPPDKDGYHYEYINGQVVKSKDFVPPPGTRLMTKVINGVVTNYYGTTTEQQP